MLTCGMYLYLQKNTVTCSDLKKPLTQEGYQNFLEIMKGKIDDEYISDEELEEMEKAAKKPEKPGKASHLHRAKNWLRKKFSRKKAAPDMVLGTPMLSEDAKESPKVDHPQEAWKKKLPPAYLDFETYKATITKVCNKGQQVCEMIKADNATNFRKRLRRKKCNSFCGKKTCRDLFTLATCYSFAAHGLDGILRDEIGDEGAICPMDTVKNCLKNIHTTGFVQQLANRGWGDAWDKKKAAKEALKNTKEFSEGRSVIVQNAPSESDVSKKKESTSHEVKKEVQEGETQEKSAGETQSQSEKYAWLRDHWDTVFFLTSTEPAKGKHLGFRIAQGGAVLAVVAALPFVLHAAAPALMLKAGSWVSQYGVFQGLEKARGKVSGATLDRIKAFVSKVSKSKLSSRIIGHCYCQCPG